MILVDLSQIMMASTMMSMEKGQTEADVDFVRHSVLNSLRMYRSSYFEEYGELVICCDAPNSWRKEYFPLYKAGRKTTRESSPLNWEQIFDCFNTIKTELKTIFPYKFIQVDRAEADDVIAMICRSINSDEKMMIISSDKDFIQLHSKNVKQWSPVTKKYIDNFVLHNAELNGRTDTEIRNFHRNEKLIDLKQTPKDIGDMIWREYTRSPEGSRKNLLNFFVEKRLNNLIESIGEF